MAAPLSRLVPAEGTEFPLIAAVPPPGDRSLSLLARLLVRQPPIVAERGRLWEVRAGAGIVALLRAYFLPSEWPGIRLPCLRASTAGDSLVVSDAQVLDTLVGRSTSAVDREVRRALRRQLGFSLKRKSREPLALLTTARVIK